MTQADTAIEARIRERLLAAFPDHGLVGEEYGTEAGDASVRWYIDPIDGTHNYIRGVPLFGTLLAVERDGELQAAVMSAPALDERWWAWRAGGAWARNRGEAARRDLGVAGHSARRRPGALRLGARHRAVGPRARARGAPRRGLAGARLRGLLGLRARRRRRGGGDGRGRAEVVGRRGARRSSSRRPAAGRPTSTGRRAIDSRDVPRLERPPARDHPEPVAGAMREEPGCRNRCRRRRPRRRGPANRPRPSAGRAGDRRPASAPDPVDRALEPAGGAVARLQRSVQPGRACS